MIRHHVRSYGNNKIMAIKAVRELASCGLKEAKDIVEQTMGFFVTANATTQARVAEETARYGIEFDPPLDGTVAAPASPTVDTRLHARGTGLSWFHARGTGLWSVRYVVGTELISAIKLVRELTGLGLAESKDVVQQCKIVRTNLTRAEAEEYARRFAAIGSRVELHEAGVRTEARLHDYLKEDDYDF